MFFERGMKNDASIWVIEEKSELGLWILESETFKKEKRKITSVLNSDQPKKGSINFSFIHKNFQVEWSKIMDIGQSGAIGKMSWMATKGPKTGIYDLVLKDDFNFEAGTRWLPLEYLTSLGRKADFTPYSIEIRLKRTATFLRGWKPPNSFALDHCLKAIALLEWCS